MSTLSGTFKHIYKKTSLNKHPELLKYSKELNKCCGDVKKEIKKKVIDILIKDTNLQKECKEKCNITYLDVIINGDKYELHI